MRPTHYSLWGILRNKEGLFGPALHQTLHVWSGVRPQTGERVTGCGFITTGFKGLDSLPFPSFRLKFVVAVHHTGVGLPALPLRPV